jgi:crotonobetaine/carnitine-CoA ligase
MVALLKDGLLTDILRQRASEDGERTFLRVAGGGSSTFAQSYEAACSIANGLIALGVEPAECVVIMAHNALDSVHSWLGINLAGATEVAINTGYRGSSLEHVLQNAQARLMFVTPDLIERVLEVRAQLTHLETLIVYGADDAPIPANLPWKVVRFSWVASHPPTAPARRVSRDHIASVVYTSGTTGPAKGVMMPHGQVALFARLGVEGAALTSDDVWYCFIPLYHVAGKHIAILGSMMAGGQVVLDTQFTAEKFLDVVRGHGITIALIHGPLVEMVYKQPARPNDADNTLTRVIASPFPGKIALDFEKRFGVRGIETWGMTEVTVPIWQPLDEPMRVGACGKLRSEYFELRIVDPDTDEEMPAGATGEFALRPRLPFIMMQGYLRMPEATLSAWRNLWFHTGDLGYIDPTGYVYFVDRAKERIRRRAENISSYDIEAAALQHDAIAECAAVGVPSEFEGDDDIKLYVVRARGLALEAEDVIRYLVTRLPHFMVPRYIEFIDAIPRTPTGKLQKVGLKTRGITAQTWDRKSAGVSVGDLARGRR